MTELDKLIQAAQVVIDAYSKHGFMMTGHDSGQTALANLSQAVEQAKGVSVEPVDEQYMCFKRFDDGEVSYSWATETELDTLHKWKKVSPEVKRNLYTTPPSIYALIAGAVAKEREACAQIADSFVGCEAIASKIRARSGK